MSPCEAMDDTPIADPASFKEGVGERLRMAVDALKLRPSDVAAALGVSQSKFGHWMSGRHFPDEYYVYLLWRRFGVTADWLYLARLDAVPFFLAEPLWSALEASSGVSSERALQEGEA